MSTVPHSHLPEFAGRTAGSFALREADPNEDKPALIAFWQGIFGDYSEARYDWLYRRNPYGSKCLLLTDSKGPVIGAVSVLIRPVFVDGRHGVGGQTVDFAVAPKYRFGAAALTLKKALLDYCRDSRIDFLYGFPLPGAERLQRRVGFQPIGHFARWVLPLRSDYLLARHIKGPGLRRALRVPADLGLSLRWRYKGRKSPSADLCDWTPDDRIDGLASEVCHAFAATGLRTCDYLRWRFGGKAVRFSALEEEAGRPSAFIAYESCQGGIRVRDLFASGPAQSRNLLSAISHRANENGAEFIEFNVLAPASWQHMLRELGFIRRDPGLRVLARRLHAEVDGPLSGDCLFTEADKDIQ